MYGTVAPGSCPWAGLGVGAGASMYCGHISSFFVFVFSFSENMVVAHWNHLDEEVPMSTHNIQEITQKK